MRAIPIVSTVPVSVSSLPRGLKDCPNCGSTPAFHQVRNFDPIARDGDVFCKICGGYVRSYDPG